MCTKLLLQSDITSFSSDYTQTTIQIMLSFGLSTNS